MSAMNTGAGRSMEDYVLTSKRYIEWFREFEQIKIPEDLFNDEKRRTEIRVSEARAALVRTLLVSKVPLAQYETKLEEYVKWENKLAVLLDAGCRCKFQSFEKMHDRLVAEHGEKFQAMEEAQFARRQTGLRNDNRSNHTHQEPRANVATDSPDPSSARESTWIQSNTSTTMSPETENPNTRPQKRAGENTHVNVTEQPVFLPDEPSTASDMLGTKASHSENNKRRRTTTELSSETEQPKRPRLGDSIDTPREGASDGGGENETTGSWSQLTIEFDELYQDGEAEYKHHIVQWPSVGGKWYIIRCDKHGMHFGTSPLHAGGQHLAGKSHNNMQKTPEVVIKELGIEVLNCDLEKQTLNNELFKRLVDSGKYHPLNNRWAANFQRPPPSQTRGSSRRSRDSHEWVTDARPGEIYKVLCPNLGVYLAAVILPRDCFNDPSFDEIGLPGGALEDTCLLENIPACYRVCTMTGKIAGWANGYEDGGELITDREFPVLCFDGLPYLRKTSVTWRSAKDLRTFDMNSPREEKQIIENYKYLEQFLAIRGRQKQRAHGEGRVQEAEEEAVVSPVRTQQPSPLQAAGILVTTGAVGEGSGSPDGPAVNHLQNSSIQCDPQRRHGYGPIIQAEEESEGSPRVGEEISMGAPVQPDLPSPNGEAQEQPQRHPEYNTGQTIQEPDAGPQQRTEVAGRSGSRDRSAIEVLQEIQRAASAGAPQGCPPNAGPHEHQTDATRSPLQPRYASVNHIRNRRAEAVRSSREIRTGGGAPTSEPRFVPIPGSQRSHHLNPAGPSDIPSTPPYASTMGTRQLIILETPYDSLGATEVQGPEQREAPEQTHQSSSDVQPQLSQPTAHAFAGQAQFSNEFRPSTSTPGPVQNPTHTPQSRRSPLQFSSDIIAPGAQVSDATFVQGNDTSAYIRVPEAVMGAPHDSDFGDSYDPQGEIWDF
ncbi:hypothetical protein SAPIO_CDS5725 [Scedosporium apiospermum]|uniref:Uncharacterized protein n=1 Tax=Pseudallescheria apiosperma TaxID=563466 RepID=A0A084G598_PSEDA|nr:uncharacterized protein SAPIO_CDS5725 [Scedosporium apiospermum]KEZ42510.1 hypothetical protein SAPIO_CDS5725 [Scedosporium apiospermum]